MKNPFGDNMPILPWMINYDSPKPKINYMQKEAARAPNYLDYQSKLSIHSKCGGHVLTSLLCMLGTNNSDVEFITELLKAGIRCVCVDLSRGDEKEQLTLLTNIRTAVLDYNETCGRIYPFAVALELTGFRIRTGLLETKNLSDILLEEGDAVYLTPSNDYRCHCSKNMIYVNYKRILKVLKPSNLIYIDYGAIILKVVDVPNVYMNIKCVVISGGKLRDEAIIHLPNIPQEYDSVMRAELVTFAIKSEADVLIIPRAQRSHNIENIRELLGEDGQNVMLIAKIEDPLGVDNIDEILETADGIIIARGELGMTLPPEKLFIVQKSIIAKCNKVGKPVICGTHILQSMAKRRLPSRAEMLDVANSILDGADGLILSEEIISGNNPLHSITLVQNICLEAEAAAFHKEVTSNLLSIILSEINEPTVSIAISATDVAKKCNAVCIMVLTVSGKSAKLISRFRPQCPIIAVTKFGHVARKLNIWRAIIPLQYISKPRSDFVKDMDKRFEYAITFGKFAGLIKGGDALVLVSGYREGSGFTNTVRVVFASQTNCLPIKKKTCKPK